MSTDAWDYYEPMYPEGPEPDGCILIVCAIAVILLLTYLSNN